MQPGGSGGGEGGEGDGGGGGGCVNAPPPSARTSRPASVEESVARPASVEESVALMLALRSTVMPHAWSLPELEKLGEATQLPDETQGPLTENHGGAAGAEGWCPCAPSASTHPSASQPGRHGRRPSIGARGGRELARRSSVEGGAAAGRIARPLMFGLLASG